MKRPVFFRFSKSYISRYLKFSCTIICNVKQKQKLKPLTVCTEGILKML